MDIWASVRPALTASRLEVEGPGRIVLVCRACRTRGLWISACVILENEKYWEENKSRLIREGAFHRGQGKSEDIFELKSEGQ